MHHIGMCDFVVREKNGALFERKILFFKVENVLN